MQYTMKLNNGIKHIGITIVSKVEQTLLRFQTQYFNEADQHNATVRTTCDINTTLVGMLRNIFEKIRISRYEIMNIYCVLHIG